METYLDAESKRIPNKINPKTATPRHTIIKMEKNNDNKERMLKAAKRNN